MTQTIFALMALGMVGISIKKRQKQLKAMRVPVKVKKRNEN